MSENSNLVNVYGEEGKVVVEYLSQPLQESEMEKLLEKILESDSSPVEAAKELSRIILSLAYEDSKDVQELLNSIPGINLEIKVENGRILFIINYDKENYKSEKLARLLAISIASLPQWINTRFTLETENLLKELESSEKKENL